MKLYRASLKNQGQVVDITAAGDYVRVQEATHPLILEDFEGNMRLVAHQGQAFRVTPFTGVRLTFPDPADLAIKSPRASYKSRVVSGKSGTLSMTDQFSIDLSGRAVFVVESAAGQYYILRETAGDELTSIEFDPREYSEEFNNGSPRCYVSEYGILVTYTRMGSVEGLASYDHDGNFLGKRDWSGRNETYSGGLVRPFYDGWMLQIYTEGTTQAAQALYSADLQQETILELPFSGATWEIYTNGEHEPGTIYTEKSDEVWMITDSMMDWQKIADVPAGQRMIGAFSGLAVFENYDGDITLSNGRNLESSIRYPEFGVFDNRPIIFDSDSGEAYLYDENLDVEHHLEGIRTGGYDQVAFVAAFVGLTGAVIRSGELGQYEIYRVSLPAAQGEVDAKATLLIGSGMFWDERITGTVNAVITEQPQTEISEMPPVEVSSLPSVTVEQMPSVDVQSLPSVTVEQMPSVDVQSLPSVDVASLPLVEVKPALLLDDSGTRAVTDTATEILPAAVERRAVFVRNTGAQPVALGGENVALETAAIVLEQGDSYALDVGAGAAWYAVAETEGELALLVASA